MKIKIATWICLVLLGCFSVHVCAQTPDWLGAFGTEGVDYQTLWDMETDQDGNVLMIGEFRVSDMELGGEILELPGPTISSGYAAKIGADGIAVWTKTFGEVGQTGCVMSAIQSDSDGNTYVAGYFIGFLGVALQVDDVVVEAGTGIQCFLMKLNQNGVAQWAQSINDPDALSNVHRIESIEVDSQGEVVLKGYMGASAKFGEELLTSYGFNDNFIAKCDADGNFQWALNVGGVDQDKKGDLAINSDNEIFASGIWAGDTLWCGDLYLVNDLPLVGDNYDRWIAKLDGDGNPLWLNREASTSDEWGSSLAPNTEGGVMVMSRTDNEISINDVIIENAAAYVSTYNFEGGMSDLVAIIEAELDIVEGYDELYPGQIESDEFGNYYISQSYKSAQCTVGENILDNTGGIIGTLDVVVTKVSPEGEVLWATNFGGLDSDYGFRMSLASDGSLWVGGNYRSFEIEVGETTLQNLGSPEFSAFAAQLDITTGLSYASDVESIGVYPNPANEFVSFQVAPGQSDVAVIDVYDMQGRLVAQENMTLASSNRIDVSQLENGIYFLNFELNGQRFAGKFVVNRYIH